MIVQQIKQIVTPHQEMYALYDDCEGGYIKVRVSMIALLEDGRLEPIDLVDGMFDLCINSKNYVGLYDKEDAAMKISDCEK